MGKDRKEIDALLGIKPTDDAKGGDDKSAEELEKFTQSGNPGHEDLNDDADDADEEGEHTENTDDSTQGGDEGESSDGGEGDADGSGDSDDGDGESDKKDETDEDYRIRMMNTLLGDDQDDEGDEGGDDDDGEGDESGSHDTPPEPLSFITEAEFKDAIKSPKKFNEILNKVYSQAREDVVRDVPELARNMVSNEMYTRTAVKEYFEQNKELDPYRKYVSFVANKIQSKNPKKPVSEILAEAGERTRKDLNIKAKAKRVEDKRRKAPRQPGKPRGSRSSGTKSKNKQQEQIGNMLDV